MIDNIYQCKYIVQNKFLNFKKSNLSKLDNNNLYIIYYYLLLEKTSFTILAYNIKLVSTS